VEVEGTFFLAVAKEEYSRCQVVLCQYLCLLVWIVVTISNQIESKSWLHSVTSAE